MRNMLAFLAAAVLAVAGMGWYLDWYKVRSQPASVPGQRSLSIDINTPKIATDLHKGEQRIQEMLENNKDGKADAKSADKDASAKSATPSTAPAAKGAH